MSKALWIPLTLNCKIFPANNLLQMPPRTLGAPQHKIHLIASVLLNFGEVVTCCLNYNIKNNTTIAPLSSCSRRRRHQGPPHSAPPYIFCKSAPWKFLMWPPLPPCSQTTAPSFSVIIPKQQRQGTGKWKGTTGGTKKRKRRKKLTRWLTALRKHFT